MSKDGDDGAGRIDRRNYLRTLGMAGVASLVGLSGNVIAASSDHPKIPEAHLGPDVKKLVRLPVESGFTRQVEGANVLAVYKVIRKGGAAEYLQIGSGGKQIEFDLIINEEEESFRVEEVETPDGTRLMEPEGVPALAPSGLSQANLRVEIEQHDVIHYDLCKTRQYLFWNYNGDSASFAARYKSEIPVSPTVPGTHWYLESAEWVGSANVIDGGRTVISGNRADYYNTDMPGGGRTDVGHQLTIEGYRSGSSYYYATVTKSGYLHEALHHHTSVI